MDSKSAPHQPRKSFMLTDANAVYTNSTRESTSSNARCGMPTSACFGGFSSQSIEYSQSKFGLDEQLLAGCWSRQTTEPALRRGMPGEGVADLQDSDRWIRQISEPLFNHSHIHPTNGIVPTEFRPRIQSPKAARILIPGEFSHQQLSCPTDGEQAANEARQSQVSDMPDQLITSTSLVSQDASKKPHPAQSFVGAHKVRGSLLSSLGTSENTAAAIDCMPSTLANMRDPVVGPVIVSRVHRTFIEFAVRSNKDLLRSRSVPPWM